MNINIDITKEDLDDLDLILMCVNEIEEELSYETSDAINRVEKLIEKLGNEFESANKVRKAFEVIRAEGKSRYMRRRLK